MRNGTFRSVFGLRSRSYQVVRGRPRLSTIQVYVTQCTETLLRFMNVSNDALTVYKKILFLNLT